MTICSICKADSPVVTVTVLAVTAGKGTRVGDQCGRKRRVARLRFPAYCLECLRTAEFRFKGAEFRFPDAGMRRDGVPPPQNGSKCERGM